MNDWTGLDCEHCRLTVAQGSWAPSAVGTWVHVVAIEEDRVRELYTCVTSLMYAGMPVPSSLYSDMVATPDWDRWGEFNEATEQLALAKRKMWSEIAGSVSWDGTL